MTHVSSDTGTPTLARRPDLLRANPLHSVRLQILRSAGRMTLALSGLAFLVAFGGLMVGNFDLRLLMLGILVLAESIAVLTLASQQRVTAAGLVMIATFIAATYLQDRLGGVLVSTLMGALFTAYFVQNDLLFLLFMSPIIARYIMLTNSLIIQMEGPVLASDLVPIGGFVSIIFIAILTRAFVRASQQAADDANRSADLLRVAAEVGQITTTILDLQQLFVQAVEIIRNRFGYYHVQVFLVNEEETHAELVASTGSVGRQLLERGHRLGVGSRSVIGRVTLTGEVVRVSNTERGSVHARNELLPDTRAEMALPIIDGSKIIGALDVQSVHASAFNETDIRALEVLASQLATAVRNARLFEEQAARSEENKRLYIAAQTSLAEIERLNRQLTGDAWRSYMDRERDVTGITALGENIDQGAEWTAAMHEAARRRRPYIPPERDRIAVPVLLRDEVIGAVEIMVEPGTEPQDLQETVKSITQRLALSLDNARLYEESQVTASRQRHINEIVGRYQTAHSIDDLLHITLTELSESLAAQQAAIRISTNAVGGNGRTNGHSNGHGGSLDHDGGNA